MRLKVHEIGRGLHPSEVVFELRTTTGPERVAVDRKSLRNGRPLAERRGQWLIELPRETMSGTWRVWVKRNEIVPETQEAITA